MWNNLAKYLINHSRKKIIFPFYHIVSDDDCPHVKHLYKIKPVTQFKNELKFLLKHFQPINLEELNQYVQTNKQPKKPSFFLSFDDGLRECFTVISPILKERKIPAAFFINTGFVENRDLFYRYKISLLIDALQKPHNKHDFTLRQLLALNYSDTEIINQVSQSLCVDFDEFLEKNKPYMIWEEIDELNQKGFYFGGHSVNHPVYSQISLEEQILQTESSVYEVVQRLGLNYKIFSFPFSDNGVSTHFFQKIFEEEICDLTFASGRMKADEFIKNIHRFGLEPNLGSVEFFVIKRYTTYLINSMLYRNKIVHPLFQVDETINPY